jgi:hypothetical protein
MKCSRGGPFTGESVSETMAYWLWRYRRKRTAPSAGVAEAI